MNWLLMIMMMTTVVVTIIMLLLLLLLVGDADDYAVPVGISLSTLAGRSRFPNDRLSVAP